MGIRDRIFKNHAEDWVEWLSDEPLPKKAADKPAEPVVHRRPSSSDDQARDRLRRAGVSRPNPVSAPTTNNTGAPTVSINIHIPKLKLPKAKLPPVKQLRYWTAFSVIIITSSLGARALLGVAFNGDKSGKTGVKGSSTVNTKPTFKPAVPGDKKDLATSNGTTSRYVPGKQLYTFIDTLLGGQITISEQPLPDAVKQNPNTLKDAAKSIGATHKIETAFGPAYIATSENKTSQRVATVHENLLVFIETTRSYDDDAWKLYIESLR